MLKMIIKKLNNVLHTLFDGSRSSTSKLDVSLGLFTTGIYGAGSVLKRETNKNLLERKIKTLSKSFPIN